jgi:transposase
LELDVARGDVTTEERVVPAPLLPAKPVRGGQWRDHRQVAICWVKQTGSPWRDLPDRCGPCKTAIKPFVRAGGRHLGRLKTGD